MSNYTNSSSDASSAISAGSSSSTAPPPPPSPALLHHGNLPCGACRVLRRRCELTCPFASYFPSNEPQKFHIVHQVFGAGKVVKLLSEVPESERQAVVDSLFLEANYRISDPIHGSIGVISNLNNELRSVQAERDAAQGELSLYRFLMRRGFDFDGPDIEQQQQQPRGDAPHPPLFNHGAPAAAMPTGHIGGAMGGRAHNPSDTIMNYVNVQLPPGNENAAATAEIHPDPPENVHQDVHIKDIGAN